METFLGIDYPTLWFIVIAVLFTGYAVLDGFDFGAGAWHLFFKDPMHRKIALNSVGPLWDGNEVWLVIGGASIFAGFPLMYATLFSAMYIPFMLFLMFLIFRAVSIEVRGKETMKWWIKLWDVCYSVCSIVLPILLGVVLGNVIQGMQVGSNFDYAGTGFFEFLTWYPLTIGIFTLTLLAWHGALYLMIKTEGYMQAKLKSLSRRGFLILFVMYSIATIYTIVGIPQSITKFLETPILWLVPVVAFVSLIVSYVFYSKEKFVSAFICSSTVIAFLLITVAITVFPNLLISTIDSANTITIYNAASSQKTLGIMLFIISIGAPLLIAYTVIAMYIFRGKVKLDETSY